jgi:aconitate hydratase 2/2-methylisocitrate dehydratase
MLSAYHTHLSDRAMVGLPPLPLNAEQVASLVELLKVTPANRCGCPSADSTDSRIASLLESIKLLM